MSMCQMTDEHEIQAVMVNTDCDRDTAVHALEWANHRVSVAINRVIGQMNIAGPRCKFCGESVATKWVCCPYCGEELQKEGEE